MSVLIREIAADDINDLAALLVEVHAPHSAALPHVYQPTTVDDRTKEFLHGLLVDPDMVLFGAEDAGQLVGYVAFRLLAAPQTPLHVPRRWVAIDTVVVQAACRRQGIGEALIGHVHKWAIAHGIDQVELLVAAFNATAIAFYEKLGYTTVMHRMGRSLADSSPTQRRAEAGQ